MSFLDSKYFPIVLAFLVIYAFITVEVVWMTSAKGIDIDEFDYCSILEGGLRVEYCMIGYNGISCHSELEQLLCKELAKLTGDLEK